MTLAQRLRPYTHARKERVYVIATRDDKAGTCYPEILEFRSPDEFESWRMAGGDGLLESFEEAAQDGMGGYSACHVIEPGVGSDPWKQLQEWEEIQHDQ